MGLYGTMAQFVVGRTKEIGIRKAIGAQAVHLLAFVARRGLPAAAGIAAGILTAPVIWSSLGAFFAGIRPLGALPIVFGLLAVIATIG